MSLLSFSFLIDLGRDDRFRLPVLALDLDCFYFFSLFSPSFFLGRTGLYSPGCLKPHRNVGNNRIKSYRVVFVFYFSFFSLFREIF